MSRQDGPRTVCGNCNKVLAKHGHRRKTPSPTQQREIDAASGLERGRLLYRYTGGMDDRFAPPVVNEDGSADLECGRCSTRYHRADYLDHLYEAHDRGEPLVLLRGDDTARHAGGL